MSYEEIFAPANVEYETFGQVVCDNVPAFANMQAAHFLTKVGYDLTFSDLGAGVANKVPTVAGTSVITHTRASAAWTRLENGNWASVGAGVLRSCYAPDGTYVGALIEPLSVTNRAFFNRDLTDAGYIKTNLTASRSTGMDGVALSGSRLTCNVSGGTCLRTSAVVAANYYRPWIKRVSGTGAVWITADGGATWTDATSYLNSSYFTSDAVTPITSGAAAPIFGIRMDGAGDVVDVDFQLLSNRPTWQSPIEVPGAVAVARSAETFTATQPFGLTAGFSLVSAGCTFDVGPVTFSRVLVAVDDGTTSNRVNLTMNESSLYAACSVAGLAAGLSTGLQTSVVSDQLFAIAARAYASNLQCAAAIASGSSSGIVDATAQLPVTNRIIFASLAGGSVPLAGCIKSLKMWDSSNMISGQVLRALARMEVGGNV